MGLYDCIMLKENHIMSIGSLEKSLEKALTKYPNKPIIVEVETLDQLRAALSKKGLCVYSVTTFLLVSLGKQLSFLKECIH